MKVADKQKDYAIVFDSPEGKRVLSDLMKRCGVLSPTFVVGDSHLTSFNEGKRNVALYIVGNLKYKDGDFPKLTEEALDEWRGSR